ncbi:MAG: hypothetical protein IPJ38_11785 [Dechloromonas sp.]|uniref:Uncharacterized protein n=1 Tax=Candidatus Dechloromonas phosphorivorans TaxID=2899244 RepID=A0A935MR81_9RHOO|nr:hypothetical protein [Candidatus Dechloromonas phosphorivorans]
MCGAECLDDQFSNFVLVLGFPLLFRPGSRTFRSGLSVVKYSFEVLEELRSLSKKIFFGLRNRTSALRGLGFRVLRLRPWPRLCGNAWRSLHLCIQ